MKLEAAFNRLCTTRMGWIMVPLVGIGFVGFVVLVAETIKYLSQ